MKTDRYKLLRFTLMAASATTVIMIIITVIKNIIKWMY